MGSAGSLVRFSPSDRPDVVIRGAMMGDSLMFVGRDVAAMLGYSNTSAALSRHCSPAKKFVTIKDSMGRPKRTRMISVDDVLSMVDGSVLLVDDKLKSWINGELLGNNTASPVPVQHCLGEPVQADASSSAELVPCGSVGDGLAEDNIPADIPGWTKFTTELGGELRVKMIDGTPWFVARDVTKSLGYSNTADALSRHCRDGVVKRYTTITDRIGRRQDVRIIEEGDVYRLIFGSKKPYALSFTDWVVHRVLPEIRKTGGYGMVPAMSDEQTVERALLIVHEKNKRLEAKTAALEHRIAEDMPKVVFADAVSDSSSLILIGDLAKLLNQNGIIDIGQNRLFKRLRAHGFLKKNGDIPNMPTQEAMDRGLFRVVVNVRRDRNGEPRRNRAGQQIVTYTTKVTGKGQQFFINWFRSHPDDIADNDTK